MLFACIDPGTSSNHEDDVRSDVSSAEEEDSDSDSSLCEEEVMEDDGVWEMILVPQKKVHLLAS